jgi:hypothetical protein
VQVTQSGHAGQHVDQAAQDLVLFSSLLVCVDAAAHLEHADGREQKVASEDIKAAPRLVALVWFDVYRVILDVPHQFV